MGVCHVHSRISQVATSMAMFVNSRELQHALSWSIHVPKEEIHRVNEEVRHAMEQDQTSTKGQGRYNNYMAEERMKMCKYATEKSITRSY